MANIVCHALFLILLALNVARTLRHAMWRDELQIFQLGRASGSLTDLFHHLRYEAHGGLWDVMVWQVARLSADPASMQVLQVVLASAVWIVVYRWSPFSRVEKLLLLASYFLFFEYFVMSRSYTPGSRSGFTELRAGSNPEQSTLAHAGGFLSSYITVWTDASI